jgi:hypothetical protein
MVVTAAAFRSAPPTPLDCGVQTGCIEPVSKELRSSVVERVVDLVIPRFRPRGACAVAYFSEVLAEHCSTFGRVELHLKQLAAPLCMCNPMREVAMIPLGLKRLLGIQKDGPDPSQFSSAMPLCNLALML